MKAAFTYTAIGILIVVVLIRIYYMNENYQDASGNVMDSSGNMVTLSLSDLFNAMRFSASMPGTAAQTQTPAKASAPINANTNAPVSGTWTGSGSWGGPPGSVTATGSMNQMIVDRSTTQPPQPTAGPCDAGSGSISQCDGACDAMSSPGAPFNMNDYIRKDSIPCYGCTLPQ